MPDSDDAGLRFEAEERLPWLEPIEEEAPETGMAGRLAALVIAGLVGIGLIVGGLWWWQSHGEGRRGELIAAPTDPYKVPAPPEKGRFDGEGNAAAAAAEGVPTPGRVDASRVPEQPVPPVAGAPRVAVAPAASPRPASATPARAAPVAAASATAPAAAAPATGGSTIQIAAFSSEAAAARAWDGLKARFAWLASVNRSIAPATVNGRTVYRLQAQAGSPAAATALCQRLRVAGENCIIAR